MRILRAPKEIAYVVLVSVYTLAQEIPAIFRPFITDFYIKSDDPLCIRLLKLQILTCIFSPEQSAILLRELQSNMRHTDGAFVSAAVRAVGRVVDVDPATAPEVLDGTCVRACVCYVCDIHICSVLSVLLCLYISGGGLLAPHSLTPPLPLATRPFLPL